jgi:hypothetical protein
VQVFLDGAQGTSPAMTPSPPRARSSPIHLRPRVGVVSAKRQWHNPSVIDHDIDGAELFDRALCEPIHLVPVGYVSDFRNESPCASGLLHLVGFRLLCWLVNA